MATFKDSFANGQAGRLVRGMLIPPGIGTTGTGIAYAEQNPGEFVARAAVTVADTLWEPYRLVVKYVATQDDAGWNASGDVIVDRDYQHAYSGQFTGDLPGGAFAGTGQISLNPPAGSVSYTAREQQKIDGVFTDYDALPTLSDRSATYGVRLVSDGSVVVAAGATFTKDDTGRYSYTITGLTPGETYQYSFARTYLGATNWTAVTFQAPIGVAKGYYTTQALIQQRGGKVNTDAEADLDGTGLGIAAVYQNVIDRNDQWADRELRAANYVAPIPLDSADFAQAQDILTDRARAVLYFVRGQFDEKPNLPSGQFAVLKMEAEARFRAMLSPLNVPLDCPTTQTGPTGPQAVETHRRRFGFGWGGERCE